MSHHLLGPDYTGRVCKFFEGLTEIPSRNETRSLVLASIYVTVGSQQPALLARIPGKIREEIAKLSAAVCEVMQNRILQKPYSSLAFPQTASVIRQYCSMSTEEVVFVQKISKLALWILPFEQFGYSNASFERAEIALLRGVRQNIASQFLGITDPPSPDEAKMGALDLEKVQERSLAFTRHLFTVGALVHPGDKAPLSYIDLLDAWTQAKAQEREAIRERVFECAVVKPTDLDASRINEIYLRHAEGSFRRFLVGATLENIQVHLGFKLTPKTLEVLGEWYKSEYFRMDIAYFVTAPKELCALKLFDIFSESSISAFRLQTFQLLFLMIRHGGVALDKRPLLLEMLTCRKPYVCEIDQHYRVDSPVVAEETQAFSRTWEFFQRLVAVCTYEEPFQENRAWSLFYYFLRNREAFIGRVVALFETLAGELGVKPSFEKVLRFCEKNPGMNGGSSQHLLNAHRDCREILDQSPVLTYMPRLFIEPPICLAESSQVLIWVKPNATAFRDITVEFELEVNELYFDCLQLFLLRKLKPIFTLLQDHRLVDVRTITTELLYDYLHSSHTSYAKVPKEENKAVCAGIVRSISSSHKTTPLQRVLLYRDLMILHVDGKLQVLREMHELISQMEEFCFHVPIDLICFFYQFHPQVLSEFRKVREFKDEFLKADLRRVILDPKLLGETFKTVRDFSLIVTAPCPEERARRKVEASLSDALVVAFVPPIEPLIKHFHINSKLDRMGEVQWELDPRVDSLGHCVPVIPGSQKSIHLDWSVVEKCPCLSLSFINDKTGETRATYVRLGIPLEEMEVEEKRKSLINFLYRMSQFVFKEQVSQGQEVHWQASQKSTRDSERCLVGFKEELAGSLKTPDLARKLSSTVLSYLESSERSVEVEEEVGKVFNPSFVTEKWVDAVFSFLEEIKVSYRLLNLGNVAFDVSFSVLQVAARGDISMVDNHPALLPKIWMLNQPKAEAYYSNIQGQVEDLQRLFGEKTSISKPLETPIIISPDGKGLQELGVFYSVEVRFDEDAVPKEVEADEEEKALVLPSNCVTIFCRFKERNIRSVMLYDSHLFRDPDLFRKRCNVHFLMLKAKVYRHIVEELKP